MEFRIRVICVDDNGAACQNDVLVLRRDEPLAVETLGLTLDDGKQLLRGLQRYVVDQQAAAYLACHQDCPHCGRRFATKERGGRSVQTVYGPCVVQNPRWHRCACERLGAKTFRPTAAWLTSRASPELLYIETKWASLIPFAKVVDLLRDVLPVSNTLNPETVRNHLHATATRLEHALGDEQPSLFEGSEEDWAAQPCPDGPMTVGIDGGMLRARGKAGFFEAIAGKSIVAFRRDAVDDVPSARRFAFVQTYDTKPRRRLWELMKSQGMQENQQITFMSDGADTVRNLQAYLHPSSEHVLDWFHVAMRVTVLKQQAKSVREERAELSADADTILERAKHFLWHGNVDGALETLGTLSFDLERHRLSTTIAKLHKGVTEFDTYIRNNRAFIPNFGERYRQGDTISTSFVESTINQVISKRFVKKQQMQWTPKGAHLLLQTRTRVLDDELEAAFRTWYPSFRPTTAAAPPAF